MNILVLGASGGCGSWACRLAADRGHQVRAVVRDGSYPPAPDNIEVIHADVLTEDVWPSLLTDQEAVVSALGIKRVNPRNPFSRLASPPGLTTRVMRHVVAFASPSIRKVAAISAAGAGSSFSNTAAMIRWMIEHSNMKASYRDLASMEAVLQESGMNWMAVRPTTLYDGPPTGKARQVDSYRLLSRVSRGDVAQWMIDFVESAAPPESRTPLLACTS